MSDENAPQGHAGPGDEFNPLVMLKPFGSLLLLIGLILVVFAKGCSSLALISASDTASDARLEVMEFEHETEAKSNSIQSEIDEINAMDREDRTESDDERKKELEEELKEWRDDRRDEKKKLSQGEWHEAQFDAQTAMMKLPGKQYFYEAFFIFGSLVLIVGLLVVGFSETGPARWVALIMIAILTFSIYIGGAAWISALISQVGGMMPGGLG